MSLLSAADQILFILYLNGIIMGLDYKDSDEPTVIFTKPTCDKCKNELKANNMFSVDDGKTLCGNCRKEYQSYITKFYNS